MSSKRTSSKRASSKKASSINVSYSRNTFLPNAEKSKSLGSYKQEFNIIGVVINILIIYYIINLEDVSCKCIMDWRHNYIKYIAIFNLLFNILLLFDVNIENLSSINAILNLINIYAFFTYIGDLNDTKCECAVVKQVNLNYFLNIWRYVIIIVPILVLVFVFGIISYYKTTSTKSIHYDPKLKIYTVKKN